MELFCPVKKGHANDFQICKAPLQRGKSILIFMSMVDRNIKIKGLTISRKV